MLLFNREIQTTGDLPAMMPLIQEFVNIAKSVGVPLQAWLGTNGCVAGSMAFSANYESLAARADGTAKLMAAKGWWETLANSASMPFLPSQTTFTPMFVAEQLA
jgi:hypothetical protein